MYRRMQYLEVGGIITSAWVDKDGAGHYEIWYGADGNNHIPKFDAVQIGGIITSCGVIAGTPYYKVDYNG